jgi:replicative superfamily II helicase
MKMNYLYVVGTSGGKTLIMEEAAAELFIGGKGKVMFVFPYVELASEKHLDLMSRFDGLSVKGFYGPSSDSDLSFEDIAVCTPEKAYHIITQSPVDLLLINEIHLINDPSRGHVVESLIYVAMSCHLLRLIGTTAPLTKEDAVILSNVMRAHLYYDESGQQTQMISYIFNDVLSYSFNGVTASKEVSNTYILEKMEKNYIEGQSFLSFCITIDNTQSEASNFLTHLRSHNVASIIQLDDSCDMDIKTVEAASRELACLMKY